MDSLTAWTWDEREGCEDRGSGRLREFEREQREAAFVALVERQGRFLYRVAYAVLRNSHDAEDAVQEAFLKLHRTGAWQGMQEEKAYLARVVWRIAVERRPRGEQVEVEDLAARGDSPEMDAMRNVEAMRLRRMIGELPEELRQTLMLSALEEMSSREVGLVMGIPEGTVRTRLMRAREELRRRYGAKREGQR